MEHNRIAVYECPSETDFFVKSMTEFDLKTINLVVEQLADERGIPREKMAEAIESALATAYKKEYGKRGQIVRAHFDSASGGVDL